MKENRFFEEVFKITRLIPSGRVTTYGAIARYLGTGQSARVVGWALNNSNYFESLIPAHRVVNRKGLLTGKHHFGNANTMRQLLENEGVRIENDLIMNFEQHFWDPGKELAC